LEALLTDFQRITLSFKKPSGVAKKDPIFA